MAKSLRSKSKLKAKSVKRGKEFQKAVDERTLRLNSKLQQNLIQQKKDQLEKKKEAGEDLTVQEQNLVNEEESMAVDEEEKKKVSTSGLRNARHFNYKMGKKKKNNSTHFGKKK